MSWAARLILLAGLLAAAVPASAGGAPAARWSLQSSHTTATLLDISCPSPSRCMAVGARATVITTVDGGRTWKRATTAYGTAVFTAVRCPVPGVCSVLDPPSTILRTTNNGRTWAEIAIPLTSHYSGLSKLACPTRPTCFVTASPSGTPFTWYTHSAAIFKTDSGGNFWQKERIPPRVSCPGSCGPRSVIGYDLQWISCQSARSCRAGGNTFIGSHEGWASGVLRTDNGGTTWGLANGSSAPNVGTCPTVTVCAGVYYQPGTPNIGPDFERSTDSGAGWAIKPMSTVLTAIACTGPSFCALAGPHGTLATAEMMQITAQRSPTGRDLSAIACPRQTACYAVGAGGTVVALKG
jgi:hypothetical protein